METIKQLAEYLEVQIAETDICRLLEFVSFANMKEFMSGQIKKTFNNIKSDLEFFNKGQIGNWKAHLSDEQSRRIDQVVEKNLTYTKKPIQYEPKA